MSERKCASCSEWKNIESFYTRNGRITGKCRGCHVAAAKARPTSQRLKSRAKQLARYNLSPEQYARMMARQNGQCAICQIVMTSGNSGGTMACVDHNHQTGSVRDILCSKCNSALGHLRDDPALARAAEAYLIRHARNDRDE